MQDDVGEIRAAEFGFKRWLVRLHAVLGVPLGLSMGASLLALPVWPWIGVTGPILALLAAAQGTWVSANAVRRLRSDAPALAMSTTGIECNYLIGFHESWGVSWDKVIAVYPGPKSVVLRVETEAIALPRLGPVGRMARSVWGQRAEIYIPTGCIEGGEARVLGGIRRLAPSVSVWQSRSMVEKRGMRVKDVLQFLGL